MNWERIPFCIPYNSLCRFMKLTQQVNRFVSWEERGNLPYLIFSPKVIIIFTKERLQILS